MKRIFVNLLQTQTEGRISDWALLVFRVLLSVQMIYVHGIKKFSEAPEEVPNPFQMPAMLVYVYAILSSVFFPVLTALGLFTRISAAAVLLTTLIGYFFVHGADDASVRDVPYMYSVSFLLVLILGPGRFAADTWLYAKLK
jgi:putative oxidoreductase